MTDLPPAERQALRDAPMFSALDNEQLLMIVRSGDRIDLQRGQVLFSMGQPAEAMYAILTGQVQLVKLAPDGTQQQLHHYGPGDTFGEAVALKRSAYPAQAEALTDATVLQIRREVLLDLIRQNGELAAGMMAGLSEKLREFTRLVADLGLRSVPQRLARALLAESRRAGQPHFRLTMSKKQLAEQLGTTPETLSRSLRDLVDAGLIAMDGRTIELLDTDSLADHFEL